MRSSSTTRIDSHCHSKASDGAAIAPLKPLGCPECYSEPEQVYDQALARGMNLVTITDHDSIDGVMDLVERGFENVITGEEVTVCFPEDGCRLHVLVWGLTPNQHEQIEVLGLRRDVYAFAQWLHENRLAHALAHPLYIQNGRLNESHIERCALLFKGFEVLNGAHAPSHRAAIEPFLDRLDAAAVDKLGKHHGLEATWSESWVKARTGGSDDHGLLNIGRTWTEIDQSPCDPASFLEAVREGRCRPAGASGHSSLMAHQWMGVAANYHARRLHDRLGPGGRLAGSMLCRFAGVRVERPSIATLALRRVARRLRRRRMLPLKHALRECLLPVLKTYPELQSRVRDVDSVDGAAISRHDRMSAFADDLVDALDRTLGDGLARAWRRRDTRSIIDHGASIAGAHVLQIPYLISLFLQNKERAFVERFMRHTDDPAAPPNRPLRVSLFTDTLGDVNGVCRFILSSAAQAEETGRDLQVITSTKLPCPAWRTILNFDPAWSTTVPRYENLEVVIPPVMRILRHIDEHQPDLIHVSTPGPVGLVGLLGACMLRVPVVGVYHTDFPAYVSHLFDDESLIGTTQEAMRLFYGLFESVLTRSEVYGTALERIGIDAGNIRPILPGVDTESFHPRFRDEEAWKRMGLPEIGVRFAFIGRISVEKNLPFLVRVWKDARREMQHRGVDASLVVVGDGPYRTKMERELRGCDAHFVGFRHAEELAMLYATSDMLLFPSVTDTLGQVVMEAAASGIPSIVTDRGGPREVVEDGRTGRVLPVDERTWVRALVEAASDEDLRSQGRAARDLMSRFTLAHAFDDFWLAHEEAWIRHLERSSMPPPLEVTTRLRRRMSQK